MKRTILLIAIVLFTVTVFGQKTISNPKEVLDTTYNGTHFLYSWNNGLFRTQVVDSLRVDSVFNFNYFSLKGSDIEVTIKKQRIIATGDTIVRFEHIQIPFVDIWKAMNDFYTSSIVKKQIKKALKDSYKKKVSEE